MRFRTHQSQKHAIDLTVVEASSAAVFVARAALRKRHCEADEAGDFSSRSTWGEPE
jgi:hypothetical protein